MTIHVTQAHINAGVRQSCSTCPIALAVRDAIGPCFVSDKSLYDDWGDSFREWHSYQLPALAQDFIKSFDLGQPVQPFSFEVEIPVSQEVRS